MMTLKIGGITIKYVGTILAKEESPMYNKTLRYSYDLNDKELILNFELAGKSKEDVKVKYTNQALSIKLNDKETYSVNFDRYADLDNYELEETKASMKNGLLSVRVPKKKERECDIKIE